MISYKNLHTKAIGCLYAFNTGDAIVYRDKYVGAKRSGSGKPHDFRRQTITVLKTIGNKIIHYRAKLSQRTYTHGTSGGAV